MIKALLPRRVRAGREPLALGFESHWLTQGYPGPGARLAVACSGGMDSLTLLHLLRFSTPALDVRPVVAHFDHRMRVGSELDAEWLRGVSASWVLPVVLGESPRTPTDEAEARELRYQFLEGLVQRGEVDAVLTAHHADDQVETVLFRALRGTGVTGLRGIPARRAPGVLRPLLPFARAEVQSYAVGQHLRPRIDPTNRSLHFARNRVRLQLLPLLEEVHPGARTGLLRLARNAARVGGALDALLAPLLERIEVARSDGTISLDRSRLLECPDPVRPELLRSAARSAGIRLSESGTELAAEFIKSARSGSRLDLGAGSRIQRDYGQFRLTTRHSRDREPGGE